MTALRAVLGAVGVGLLGVGVTFVLQLGFSDLLSAAIWMAAGVLAHDAILAPIVVALGVLWSMFLPGWAKAPAAVGAVILFSVSLTAFPVIGRFGAKATDPWLLDKPYLASWFGFVALVMAGVMIGSTVIRRRARPRAPE